MNTFLEEYRKKNSLIEILQSTYRAYGYQKISVPTLESYGAFSYVAGRIIDNTYKLVDASGELLVLRSDITIPIAKIASRQLKAEDETLKVFYSSKVYRMPLERGFESRELIQSGVEYFGNNLMECDGELIVLAIESLKNAEINLQIEIGHIGYITGLLKELKLKKDNSDLIKGYIEHKSIGDIKILLRDLNIKGDIKDALIELPNLYGEYQETLLKGKKYCLNKEMEKSIKDLETLYYFLEDHGYGENISLDLGLVNPIDYYTGIVYRGYTSNHGKIVLRGGRYNKLTHEFGKDIPGCGFAINIEELMKGVGKMQLLDKCKYVDYLILFQEHERKASISISSQLRELGFVVETESIKGNLKETIQRAEKKGTNEVIIIQEDKMKLISIRNNSTMNISPVDFLKELNVKGEKQLLSIH